MTPACSNRFEKTASGLWVDPSAIQNSSRDHEPPSGTYLVDRRRVILDWDEDAEQITLLQRDDVVGRRCAAILKHHPQGKRSLCGSACPLNGSISAGNLGQADVMARFRDNEEEVWVRTSPLLRHGKTIGGIHVFGKGHGDREVNQDEMPGEYADEDLDQLARELLENSSWTDVEKSTLTLTESEVARHVVRFTCTPAKAGTGRWAGPDSPYGIPVPLFFYRKESPKGLSIDLTSTEGVRPQPLPPTEANQLASRVLARAIKKKKGSLTAAQWSHVQSLTKHHSTARERARMLLCELHPLNEPIASLIDTLSRNHLYFVLLPVQQHPTHHVLTCTATVRCESQPVRSRGSKRRKTETDPNAEPAPVPRTSSIASFADRSAAATENTRTYLPERPGPAQERASRMLDFCKDLLFATGYRPYGFRLRGSAQDSKLEIEVEGEPKGDYKTQYLPPASAEKELMDSGRYVMAEIPQVRLWPALMASIGTTTVLAFITLSTSVQHAVLGKSPTPGSHDLRAVTLLVLAPGVLFAFLARQDHGFVSRKLQHVRMLLAITSWVLLFAATIAILNEPPFMWGLRIALFLSSCGTLFLLLGSLSHLGSILWHNVFTAFTWNGPSLSFLRGQEHEQSCDCMSRMPMKGVLNPSASSEAIAEESMGRRLASRRAAKLDARLVRRRNKYLRKAVETLGIGMFPNGSPSSSHQ